MSCMDPWLRCLLVVFRLLTVTDAAVHMCYQPALDSGFCGNMIALRDTRFSYNYQTRTCDSFAYFGCGTSLNNFRTAVECQNLCGTLYGLQTQQTQQIQQPAAYCDPPCGECQDCVPSSVQCFRAPCPTSECRYRTGCGLSVLSGQQSSSYQKPGTCPQVQSLSYRCFNTCNSDSECRNEEKCCYSGCGFACRIPIATSNNIILVSKPGNCPLVRVDPATRSSCADRCTTDADCLGSMRCCSTLGCGRECANPDGVTTSQSQNQMLNQPTGSTTRFGLCPFIPPGQFGACQQRCQSDSDCLNNLLQKCCSNGCGTECVNPITSPTSTDSLGLQFPQQKPGSCPTLLASDTAQCYQNVQQASCISDVQCTGSAKCCSNGCAMVCRQPIWSFTNANILFPQAQSVLQSNSNNFAGQQQQSINWPNPQQQQQQQQLISWPNLQQQPANGCPTVTINTSAPCADQCSSDVDCYGDGRQRCCFNGCGRSCMITATTGSATNFLPNPGVNAFVFSPDASSNLMLNAQQQQSQLQGMRSGTCPPINPATRCSNVVDYCKIDNDCPNQDRCCLYGVNCGRGCRTTQEQQNQVLG